MAGLESHCWKDSLNKKHCTTTNNQYSGVTYYLFLFLNTSIFYYTSTSTTYDSVTESITYDSVTESTYSEYYSPREWSIWW